ncbi:hypothetical protein [Streptomyces indiaensis]|uniref:Uncharacterized protein n=1 Tax=Streptomyces indiaensis TaxID=284033 RepID=A0ABP5QJZ3_9ACTN|nr:hypothetical protein [Streptomyces indiaensis]MCF1648299.1 hypothetical protein [Streptomyces indiaensis]
MSFEIKLLGAETPIAWSDETTKDAIRSYEYEVLTRGAVVTHCTTTTADKDGYAVDRSDVVAIYGPTSWQQVSGAGRHR